MWFGDGTFDASKKPFSQPFSFHAFVRKEDRVKQVSLFYSLMSSKRTTNYEAVFQAHLDLLPVEPNELTVRRASKWNRTTNRKQTIQRSDVVEMRIAASLNNQLGNTADLRGLRFSKEGEWRLLSLSNRSTPFLKAPVPEKIIVCRKFESLLRILLFIKMQIRNLDFV